MGHFKDLVHDLKEMKKGISRQSVTTMYFIFKYSYVKHFRKHLNLVKALNLRGS